MKKLISFVLIIVLLLGITACGGPADKATSDQTSAGKAAGEKKETKDTITIVTDIEPDTLDPRRGNGVANNIVMELIYQPLVQLDPEGQPYPVLAEKWEKIDDTHFRFTLNKGIKFSNGQDLKTDDVKFSLDRTLEDATSKSTMSWYDKDNTKIEDDYNIVIALKFPYQPMFYVLGAGRCWIGDMQTMKEMGEENHARKPVGTGPYKLASWESGTAIKLEANETYWGTKAKTKNLIIKFIPEPANRVVELETGSSDFCFYISGKDQDRVNKIKGFHVESGKSHKYYLVTFFMPSEKFKDKRVREALRYAIDTKALADAAFDGKAHAMTGIYPSIAEGWKDMQGFKYDPAKAKSLLKEAGLESGLEFELHILPGTEYQRMAEIIQQYWKEVGVNVKIAQSALATREAAGPWEASIRTATAAEISNILIIYEKAFASRISNNDPKLEEMLQKLKTIYEPDKRKEYLSGIQDYIYDICYTIPFAEVDSMYGISNKIEGYKFNPIVSRQNIFDWVIYK